VRARQPSRSEFFVHDVVEAQRSLDRSIWAIVRTTYPCEEQQRPPADPNFADVYRSLRHSRSSPSPQTRRRVFATTRPSREGGHDLVPTRPHIISGTMLRLVPRESKSSRASQNQETTYPRATPPRNSPRVQTKQLIHNLFQISLTRSNRIFNFCDFLRLSNRDANGVKFGHNRQVSFVES
jgi:hypothetical protein